MVGIGGQIHFRLVVAVQDTGLFIIKVVKGFPFLLVFEEGLIGADHFGIFIQTLADTGTKPDQLFNAFGGQEGIAENPFGFLPDAVHPAGTLDQADNGPGKIKIDDDGTVLKVLAFRKDVGGNQNAEFIFRSDPITFVIGFGTEAPGETGRVFGLSCYLGQSSNTTSMQLGLQITGRIGKLGKDQDFFFRMVFSEKFIEGHKLGIFVRVPLPATQKQIEQA